MTTFNRYREKFNDFYNAVKILHTTARNAHRGHGFDHDITVAQLADHIAPTEHIGEKAWCAGMIHSVDRILGNSDTQYIEKVTRKLLGHLPVGYFKEHDIEDICKAAVNHGELNTKDQSLVQRVLMDADRLANLMPAVVIRAGQFRPTVPPFEFNYLDGERNPASTYHQPKSVVDNLRALISEYTPQLRLPKAKLLARNYANVLETFLHSLEKSYQDLDLKGFEL
jgi:hypothetical protein